MFLKPDVILLGFGSKCSILNKGVVAKVKILTLWNYDTENHTESFSHSEKKHGYYTENIYKGNHIDNHT